MVSAFAKVHAVWLMVCRLVFSGGTNVTFRGTKDPEWGWIDGHGQAVKIFGDILVHRILTH